METKREVTTGLAKAAWEGGASALSAMTSVASTTARNSARLAVGTLFAGANVLLDLGVRVARQIPSTPNAEPDADKSGVHLETSEGTIPVAVRTPTTSPQRHSFLGWWFPDNELPRVGEQALAESLRQIGRDLYIVEIDGQLGVGVGGRAVLGADTAGVGPCYPLRAILPAISPGTLGDPAFREAHSVRYAYVGGSMANGIASETMVEAFSRGGMLAFFGAAGLTLPQIDAAIQRLQKKLGNLPFGMNLIHTPNEPEVEAATVDLYINRGVRLVEASAYLDLTLPLVRYRVKGLYRNANGRIVCPNRVMAKVSRIEVARKFLAPPPSHLLQALVESGEITADQAQLARTVPMADDLTAEADSGGHTDNRPAVALIPTMIALRDELQKEHGFDQVVRVGAAGGVATPASTAAMFAMGAAYVLTGSVNQACLESGTSPSVREMLAQAGQADIVMAPAADMFEMGVKLQVLKWGTMFAVRARKLYDLYRAHTSMEDLPTTQRSILERDYFHTSLTEAWSQTRSFWQERDPKQIVRAEADSKHKMALVFRSYLGQASRWAIEGIPTRKADYQVWCGPAMGAFNEWARGSFLEKAEQRKVVTVAMNLLAGAAMVLRAGWLRTQGINLPSTATDFRPAELEEIRVLTGA